MVLHVNVEPSSDLCYSSLNVDEEARRKLAKSFSKSSRFSFKLTNGNLKNVHPDVDDPKVRSKLPSHLQVDSNTRTVFRDDFYTPKAVGISEYVTEGKNFVSTMKSSTPKNLPPATLGLHDTRSLPTRDATVEECRLGPGCYDVDRLNDRGIGTLNVSPTSQGHSAHIARDPNRMSSSFLTRDRSASSSVLHATMTGSTSTAVGLDYASWTARGSQVAQSERVIAAERWGENNREPRPPPEERCNTVYDITVDSQGKPITAEAYTSDPRTRAYKASFKSGLPRLVALPGGSKADPRSVRTSHADLCCTPTHVGPGSYDLPSPTNSSMHSFHASYAEALSQSNRPPSPSRPLFHSAPTSPAAQDSMPSARSLILKALAAPPAAKPGQLAFMQRHSSYAADIRSQLKAHNDVRKERQRVKAAAAGGK